MKMDDKLVILDYDFIYSANREIWDNIALLIKATGTTIYLISQRGQNYRENVKFDKSIFADIIFTNFREKKNYAKEYFRKDVDIWINGSFEPIYIKH
jgi:hypothetical protein